MNYHATFVDGVLRLDVERSKEDSWDLSNFVEGERESEISNNFVRMDVFNRQHGGGCGNDGGGNILELTAARAGIRQLDESGRGEEQDMVMRQW